MKSLLLAFLITCACAVVHAQVNYVKNPDFEEYTKCPDDWNQINYAKFWTSVIDTTGEPFCAPEYINTCDVSGGYFASAPLNSYFYQYPRSKEGMAMAWVYSDAAYSPPDGLYRDYLQGRLFKQLTPGKSYCVTFFVNLAENSQYGISKIGAYLDDGALNKSSKPCGSVISDVIPQIFSSAVISDTENWVRIEQSFIASGKETYITIGNFFPVDSIVFKIMPAPKDAPNHFAFYLIDDVSVIETDLPAYAGPDVYALIGDSVWVGRGLDSTKGLECRWYKNGVLLSDSVAGLWAKAGTVKGIDTYMVVQTICGTVKRDTALVYTFPVGIAETEMGSAQFYTIFPNPLSGPTLGITQFIKDERPLAIELYNLPGALVFKTVMQFHDKQGWVGLPGLAPGWYLLKIRDDSGGAYYNRIQLR
jgi:hypothetical protein